MRSNAYFSYSHLSMIYHPDLTLPVFTSIAFANFLQNNLLSQVIFVQIGNGVIIFTSSLCCPSFVAFWKCNIPSCPTWRQLLQVFPLFLLSALHFGLLLQVQSHHHPDNCGRMPRCFGCICSKWPL